MAACRANFFVRHCRYPQGRIVPFRMVDAYVYFSTSQLRLGATVLQPLLGIHHDPTGVLDFSKMYPSIIGEWNLGYETELTPIAWSLQLKRTQMEDSVITGSWKSNKWMDRTSYGDGFISMQESVQPQVVRSS